MKKQILLLLMMLLPMVAGAQDVVEIDGICYELVSKIKEAIVKPKRGYYTGSVVIPACITYDGTEYKVISIDGNAFKNCSGLTSVAIPGSVTSIGDNAFQGCI